MAIAFDAASSGFNDNDGTSLTVAHTCGASANLLIASTTSNGSTVSGVTYNGVAMTLLDSIQHSTTNQWNYMWYLVNPATGASYNCIGTWVTAATSGRKLSVISFSGADIVSPIDVSGTAQGTSTTPTKSVTITVANGILVDSLMCGSSPTVGAGQTQRSNQGSGSFNYNATSTEPTTTTGSYTMSWSQGNDNWSTIVAHLSPGVSDNTTNFFAMMN